MIKLLASIVSLSRGRKHFDDQAGVQQRVEMVIGKLKLTAGHNNIGICVEPC